MDFGRLHHILERSVRVPLEGMAAALDRNTKVLEGKVEPTSTLTDLTVLSMITPDLPAEGPLWLGIWGEGYTEESPSCLVSVHGLSWFTADRGYGPSVQASIECMDVGTFVNLSDPSGRHLVVRVR